MTRYADPAVYLRWEIIKSWFWAIVLWGSILTIFVFSLIKGCELHERIERIDMNVQQLLER
jgi:hypothetical protein